MSKLNGDALLAEALAGGPGLDGYAYDAAVYCVACGEDIVRKLVRDGLAVDGTDDPLFRDSGTLPQPVFWGESDSPQYCDTCGEYLYGGDSEGDDEGGE